MKKTGGLLIVFFILSVTWTGTQELSDPEKNFEHLWKTMDEEYGIFLPKRVDWDLLYNVYRPKVTPETTDEELFDVMSQMLGHLNDNHVRLRSPFSSFGAGILQEIKREGFSRELVKEKFLSNKFEERINGRFLFGFVEESIGYFHFSGFRGVKRVRM